MRGKSQKIAGIGQPGQKYTNPFGGFGDCRIQTRGRMERAGPDALPEMDGTVFFSWIVKSCSAHTTVTGAGDQLMCPTGGVPQPSQKNKYGETQQCSFWITLKTDDPKLGFCLPGVRFMKGFSGNLGHVTPDKAWTHMYSFCSAHHNSQFFGIRLNAGNRVILMIRHRNAYHGAFGGGECEYSKADFIGRQ